MNKEESELWIEIMEFILKVQRHPKFKPETVKEAQNSLECIPAIKDVIRSIDDTEKYIEMIIMADENEEFLYSTINELQKGNKIT
jgi:vacuolar-type H+-ATPase subunit D/Vma8